VHARSNDGPIPLQFAAQDGPKDIVELLLANHTDVNATENAGSMPLHVARSDCGDYTACKNTAQLLRQHGGQE